MGRYAVLQKSFSCYGNNTQIPFVMAKINDTPFLAELRPSKNLQRLYVVIHCLALAASVANALPLAVKLVVIVFIGLNCKIGFPRLKHEHRKLKYSEKSGWAISKGDDFVAVIIARTTVITTFFIFLHLENKDTVLIANDALTEDDYRQLIVKLKMSFR